MTGWVEIGQLDDISPLGARVVRAPRGDIAVFRTSDDKVFALADRCPHKGGPLSQGIVHGERVTCPLHNWVIGLADGQAIAPDQGCVARYPVKIENGVVRLFLGEADPPESAPP
jgi:nitrite reductase (NADH) small subunit